MNETIKTLIEETKQRQEQERDSLQEKMEAQHDLAKLIGQDPELMSLYGLEK